MPGGAYGKYVTVLVCIAAVGRVNNRVKQVHAQSLGYRTFGAESHVGKVDHVPVTGIDGRSDAETPVNSLRTVEWSANSCGTAVNGEIT